MPPDTAHQLHHGNIFIFPGTFGWFYLMMTACLFLLAVNYQNNLLLFLCQFLLSLFLITLFTAYKNISGIRLSARELKPVFAGENGFMTVDITAAEGKSLRGLMEIRWYGDIDRSTLDLEQEKKSHHLAIQADKRGIMRLPRVTVTSSFPLGLVKCWTHPDFSQTLLVYPQKKPEHADLSQWYARSGNGKQVQNGTDDFFALQPWQSGEPLNRVAWKRVAKGGDRVNKIFTDQQPVSGYLDIRQLRTDTETALSVLSWQVTQLSATGTQFGLKLDNLVIQPGCGQQHKQACLKALALFRQDTPS